jgi:gamma-glutamylcyclotransferase (GGCT)/AIG2-like uncharacterized protein YtfP
MAARDQPGFVFAYGTLRRGGGGLHRLLAAGAEFHGRGAVQGRLFMVADYPGAVTSGDPAERVVGEVWRLVSRAERRLALLGRLDEYEGYDPASPERSLFVRVEESVTLDAGGTLSAWVYRYNRSTTGLTRIHSGDFLEPRRPSRRG